MTPKIYSKLQILADLNREAASKGDAGNPWVEIPDTFNLSIADIKDKTVSPGPQSLVLKTFINPKTGEIRTYLSKFLEDEPITKDL